MYNFSVHSSKLICSHTIFCSNLIFYFTEILVLPWEDTPCSLHDVLLETEGECNCPPPELNFQILPPEGQKLLEWIEQGNIILLKLNIYL